MGQSKYQNDGDPRTSGPGFALTVHPDTLDTPLWWKAPQRIFVNSMSDLFHKAVPDEFIEGVVSVMNAARQHTYQVLTKRPQRMAELLPRFSWDSNNDVSLGRYTADELGLSGNRYYDLAHWLPHVWWGTSIESDAYTWRADHLRRAPSAIRWLSLEPLLSPLPSLDLTGIDWVVVGGESGPRARPMHPDWVRDLRDRCVTAGVPFFFKQWGEWIPYEADPQPPFWDSQHGDMVDGHHFPSDLSEGDPTGGWWAAEPAFDPPVVYRRVGKKAAGRELDGRTWDEYPEGAS
jgi:protein gp37